MDENLRIFDACYEWRQLEPSTSIRYERDLVSFRQSMLNRHARGSVLDLGCGIGTYVPAMCDRYTGLDGSPNMLAGHRAKRGNATQLVCGDAHRLPFADASFDTVYAFTMLYYLANLEGALAEVRRVLRPSGRAVLELGNRASLNTLVTRRHHERSGWARPFNVPFSTIRRATEGVGQVLEWRAMQVLSMLRPGPGQWYLAPLSNPVWRWPLSARVGSRNVDELLSSAPVLRRLAFRHFVVVERS